MHKVHRLLIALVCVSGVADAASLDPLVTKALSPLPENPAAEMLTVEYAPGESSSSHRHNAHTFVYVLEGSVQMQVKGGELVTLGAGETFYESPDDVHSVSRNASESEPAKFLVFFVKETDAPGTVPAR